MRGDGPAERVVPRQLRTEDFGDREQAIGKLGWIAVGSVGEGAEADGVGVLHVDRIAGFVDAGDVPHPGGDTEGEASERLTVSKAVGDCAEQALRQLLAAVHGDLPGAVLERGIGKTGEELVAVAG